MATLQHVMWGIKSVQAKRGKPRLPITPTILSGLQQVWEKSRHGFDNIMAQVEGEFLGAIVSYTEGHTGTEVVGPISHTARGLGHQHQGDQQDECSCHSDWWCHDIDGGKIHSPST